MVLLVIFSMVSACSSGPPVQEMSDARQAIAGAGEAGAEKYAPEQLQEAKSLLSTAEQYLKSGTYWAARKSAVSAKDTALAALLRSRSAREQAEQRPVRSD